ncbi:MAG: hypothetical protein O2807_05655 [bacterium]|nr:hypothetical protein [bacterium]
MSQGKENPRRENKRGLLEYFILAIMLLVVTVTAWTLWDNGLLATLRDLIGAPPP